jgi:UDP-4-amino-4-deoxy-L-arabinose formyltransferase/UDP-glucuronic acid dehydrogenase (UDP-4-keto-hexauronic acid decarboxylating)
MNVLLVAEESAGIQVLRALAQTGQRPAGVLTTKPTRGGGATVAGAADALGIPILSSELVRDPATARWARDRDVDLLLNVHSLYVIHPDVVRAPRIGSFNLHPGPLPEYAGLNAPSWAIYHGETRHAVTVHWMEAGIDTGAIAYTASFDITEEDTGFTVSARCVREGVPLLVRLVEAAADDPASIPATPQDPSRRRYFGRSAPNDGRIVWSKPAREVVDFVRACDYLPFPSPWGHPRASLRGRGLELLKAARTHRATAAEPGTVGEARDGAVEVAAGDEWIVLRRVRLDGAALDAAEVLAPGDHLEDGT